MFSKINVNGSDAHPLFTFLKEQHPYPHDDPHHLMGNQSLIIWSPVCRYDISWNFEKFLVDQSGVPVKRYSPKFQTKDIAGDIQRLLKNESV